MIKRQKKSQHFLFLKPDWGKTTWCKIFMDKKRKICVRYTSDRYKFYFYWSNKFIGTYSIFLVVYFVREYSLKIDAGKLCVYIALLSFYIFYLMYMFSTKKY